MDHYLPAIHCALAYIEESLTEPVTLEAIARRAGFSLWHFQRIFAAYVGEPLGSYLRRRRLTEAAEELRHTERPIIDIALAYQFESHEAFTRAFAAMTQVTPSGFRRDRHFRWLKMHPFISPADLPTIARTVSLNMNPKIITAPALHLIGLEAPFIGPMSPDANNHQVIPALFQQFFARRGELPDAGDGTTYGACHCRAEQLRTREDELIYLVGVSVPTHTPVPAGMKRWDLPERTYAIFTHQGRITQIGETYGYIFGTWFARSDYSIAEGPQLEVYDARFGDGGEKSELDIMIPVQPREAPTKRKTEAK